MSTNGSPIKALKGIIKDLILKLGIEATIKYLCEEGLIDNNAAGRILATKDDVARQQIMFEELSYHLVNINILIKTLENFARDVSEGHNRYEHRIFINYMTFPPSSADNIQDLQNVLQVCNSTIEGLRKNIQDVLRTLNNFASLESVFQNVFVNGGREAILRIFYAVYWFSESDVFEIRETYGPTTTEKFLKKLIPHIVDIDRMNTVVQRCLIKEYFRERDWCRNRIIGHWKYLSENLHPDTIIDHLYQEKFIEDPSDLREKSRRVAVYFALTSVVRKINDKAGYDKFIKILEEDNKDIAEKLHTEFEVPDWSSKGEKEITIETKEQIVYTSSTDNHSKGVKMTIKTDSENKEQVEEKVKERFPFIVDLVLKLFHAYVEEVNSGSIIIQMLSLFGDFKNKVEENIQHGGIYRLLNKLLNDQEIKDTLPPGEFTLEISAEEDNVNYSKEQDDDAKCNVYPSNIVTSNRSLLMEELDPLSLLPAFAKKGVHCFDDLRLESIRLRKARTEKFLEVLEEDTGNLIEVFLDILRDQKKLYVLNCLEMSTRFENIDVLLLTKNIIKYVSDVVDEVNMKDLKNIFADRNILSDKLFEKIQENFPDNKHRRVVSLLKVIFHDGDKAIFTLLESLYRGGNEPLVETLLNGAQRRQKKEDDKDAEKSEEDENMLMLKFFGEDILSSDEDMEVTKYQTDSSRNGLIFTGTYKIIVEEPGQECLLKTILLLDVGVGMIGSDGMKELKSIVADYLKGQEFINEDKKLTEHIAVVTFGRTPELKLHFRNDCNLVQHFTEHLSTSNEQSSLIPALDLCKSLLMPGLSEEMPVDETLRKLTFHPRIILVSDGRFNPIISVSRAGVSSWVELNPAVIELCKFFKQRKVKITCIPVGLYNKMKEVEMINGYPTDPLHFLAKETGGSVVFKEFINQLAFEHTLQESIDKELQGLPPSPLVQVAQKAVENNITNVSTVMEMARDEGIEVDCPVFLEGVLMELRKRKEK